MRVSKGAPLRADLAKAIGRAAERVGKAQRERDELIVQALDEGVSTWDVAKAAGLTHTGVRMIRDRLRRDSEG